MNLVPYEKQGHELVGQRAAQASKILITLGVRAHMYAEAARRAGMKPNHILEFESIEPVTEWLKGNLTRDDAVLLKGSHGLRMDRITAALEVSS